MNDMQLYQGGNGLASGDARRASRAISRHQAGAQVRTTRVDADTDVTMAKIDATTAATGQGMAAVTKVAQLQAQLELMAPAVSGRLTYLADQHMFAVGESLSDLQRDLRRR
jgi:hypothetical protein